MEEDSSLFPATGFGRIELEKEKFAGWKKILLFFRQRGLDAGAGEGEICGVEEDSSLFRRRGLGAKAGEGEISGAEKDSSPWSSAYRPATKGGKER